MHTAGNTMESLMDIKAFDQKAVGALRNAVQAAGTLEHLSLTHAEFLEFLHTLAWFIGRPNRIRRHLSN